MSGVSVEAAMWSRRRLVQQLGLLLSGAHGLAQAQAVVPEPTRAVIDWPAMSLVDGSTLAPGAWHDTAAVVVFWATWCAYCRRHNARIEQLYRSTVGLRLRVLGVAVDADTQAVQRYRAQNDLHFPMLAGDPGLRAQFTNRRVVPITGLVDRRGRRLQVIPGEMSKDDVMALASLAEGRTT
jgi:thiol-disulfide isomerase/thioredoxin